MAHLVQRVSAFESHRRSLRKEKYLKGTAAMTDPYDADFDGDDPEVVISADMEQGSCILSIGEGVRK